MKVPSNNHEKELNKALINPLLNSHHLNYTLGSTYPLAETKIRSQPYIGSLALGITH